MLTTDPGVILEAEISLACAGFALYSAQRFWARREGLL